MKYFKYKYKYEPLYNPETGNNRFTPDFFYNLPNLKPLMLKTKYSEGEEWDLCYTEDMETDFNSLITDFNFTELDKNSLKTFLKNETDYLQDNGVFTIRNSYTDINGEVVAPLTINTN